MRCLLSLLLVGSLTALSAGDVSLGAGLTPIGGEQAGNADGSIPAWTGGIMSPISGYTDGSHHPDPFSGDAPLATITAANASSYADKLPAGTLALLKAYDDYRVVLYPSHRSAAAPQRIYDATAKNASSAKLTGEGNGIEGAVIGIPFPVPQNGLQVIWNHLCRYRGESAIRRIAQAAPQRNGSYSLVEFEDSFLFLYALPDTTEATLGNTLLYYKQATLAPARLAGSILLVQETLDQVREPRNAWIYNAGQRRVRRAPNVGYDSPGTNSDNMRTNDQFDMYNGAPDRYDWKLVGKKEMIVPYNSYKLHAKGLAYDEILKPRHINQDLARYELHRVWVVEATLKPGKSHIYARRTFYIDEDSWQVLVVDQYDQRGQIWRVSEAHCINYYEVPLFWSTLEVHTDLQAGRYLAVGLDNQNPMYDFRANLKREDFTTAALAREGVR
jgi:hypothetical protein